ncbi:MAG TPA: glycosyltransferase family 4 protein, partial [Vicinamibacteria bacterium]
FVGRQVARGLGGDLLPALFSVNDRLLEASLGIVGLTEYVRGRAARRLPGRPVLHLPHHLSLPFEEPPAREAARRDLGLPEGALIVTAPGLATAAKGLDAALHALGSLRSRHPGLLFVLAGDGDPRPLREEARAAGMGDAVLCTGRLSLSDFVRHLCAADVVLGLRFPTHGEISGALVRALGVGRPVLVTAGTPATDEFPEGIVVSVDPGPGQVAELSALLDRLLSDAPLRARIGRLARAYVSEHHGLETTVDHLALFLEGVANRRPEILRALAMDRAEEGTLMGYLLEEVRWGARDLGLPGVPLGLEPALRGLIGRSA